MFNEVMYMKPKNFSKRGSLLTIRDGTLYGKNGQLFWNKELLDIRKLSTLFIEGEYTVASTAIKIMRDAQIDLVAKSGGYPCYFSSYLTRSSKLKIKQFSLFLSKKEKAKSRKILWKARASCSKRAGLPVLPKFDNLNLSLIEARYVRRLYLQIAKQNDITWKGKDITGQETHMHMWWHLLYGVIHTCLKAMNVDPDVGFIHTCPGALVYDLSDVFKPLFLKEALKEKTSASAKVFFYIYKQNKVNKLIPLMVKGLISDRHLKCFEQRLCLDHGWRGN